MNGQLTVAVWLLRRGNSPPPLVEEAAKAARIRVERPKRRWFWKRVNDAGVVANAGAGQGAMQ